MALTADEKKLLEELTAKANEPDADDFEVEIFSGDKGARIPMSKAKGWLAKEFGIDLDPAAPPSGGDQGKQDDPKPGPVATLFGSRRAPGNAGGGAAPKTGS